MTITKSPLGKLAFVLTLTAITFSCKKSEDSTSAILEVPSVYKKIYGATSITNDGTWIYIKTKDLPDHKSAYYPATNALYEAYSGLTFGGNTFVQNPNSIVEQSGTFKIPLNPAVNASHAATPLGPIGIALNGVALFNQYAGPSQPLTGEIASFDKYYVL